MVANCLAPAPKPEKDRADQLVDQLLAEGHQVEHLRFPFSDRDIRTIAAQLVAARNLDLDGVERLIALDFPTYLLRHAHKVVWLSDGFLDGDDPLTRQTPLAPNARLGSRYRNLRSVADAEGLNEAQAVFAVSQAVSDRLSSGHGIPSRLLVQPTHDTESPASISSWKRAIAQLLA